MSSWPEMTHKQACALARFLHELRGDWDVPGIEAQLGYARGMAPGPALAIAAIKAAMTARNRTPAVIRMDGEHWRSPDPGVTRRKVGRDELCSICNQPEDRCRQLAALPDDGHAFTPNVRGAAVDTTTGEVRTRPDAGPALARVREALAVPH